MGVPYGRLGSLVAKAELASAHLYKISFEAKRLVLGIWWEPYTAQVTSPITYSGKYAFDVMMGFPWCL